MEDATRMVDDWGSRMKGALQGLAAGKLLGRDLVNSPYAGAGGVLKDYADTLSEAYKRLSSLRLRLSDLVERGLGAFQRGVDRITEELDRTTTEIQAKFTDLPIPLQEKLRWRGVHTSHDALAPFSEGLAAFRKGTKWGYVDRAGEIVVAPKFESAGQFRDGLAMVVHGGRQRFIDPSGRFVTPPKPDWLAKSTTPLGEPSRKSDTDKPTASKRSDRAVLIVIDTSGSMGGNKLQEAKAGAIEGIKTAVGKGISFKVVAFGGACDSGVRIVSDWSERPGPAIRAIDSLSAGGGTPLGPALKLGSQMLRRAVPTHKGAVILLSDGADTCGGVSPVLNWMSSQGIRFHHETIGVGVTGRAAADLKRIARLTGGNYTYAADASQIRLAFKESFRNLRKFIWDWERITK